MTDIFRKFRNFASTLWCPTGHHPTITITYKNEQTIHFYL